MRTVKRKAMPLNLKKQESLTDLCHAYAKEKQYWLDKLKGWKCQSLLGKPRVIRDEFVGEKYVSPYGLQARHWKLALQDAVEVWDKYWQAIFVCLKPKIYQKYTDEVERRYAYWLLKCYPQFAELMQGNEPEPSFEIEPSVRHQISGYIRRTLKKLKGKPPKVKKIKTVKFDANCYEVFEHKGRQYIKLMTLERGKRVVIPLLGMANIKGNLSLVFHNGLHVHIAQDLQPHIQSTDTIEAIDFGYTEVMTDTQGETYGKELGEILTTSTNERHEKMQRRHKIHALEKKYRQTKPVKARNVRKYNLGRKKLDNKATRVRQTIEREINTAINELVEKRAPSILVTENLRHSFTYNKTKNMNRKFSSWVRGRIQDRIVFKALAKGFRHEQVNPAYGSQSCPSCEFVDHRNRNGDSFKCLFCGHEDISDRIAALNYARRYGDREIGLHMSCNQVNTILLNRFHRRLEGEQSLTVPGKTLETVFQAHPQPVRDINITAGREKLSFTGRSIRERNKNTHV